MRLSINVFSGVVAMLLCACVPPQASFEDMALVQEANRPVTCRAGKDCEEKWNRAIEWVHTNSAKEIKTITANLIQTHGVRPQGERVSYPAFTIVRYAKGKDTYAMEYGSACDEIVDCDPPGMALKASFVRYVMGRPGAGETREERKRIGRMQELAAAIQRAGTECMQKRIAGKLKTYAESAECSNHRMIKAFEDANYPYMDLAHALAAKRLALAEELDDRRITEAQMQAQMMQYIADMDQAARLRNRQNALPASR